VVDGQEGPEYDGFLTTFIFDTPTAFHTLAFRGMEILRVDGEIIEE
jgi:hypothetical protein